jgi:hypothetical protein
MHACDERPEFVDEMHFQGVDSSEWEPNLDWLSKSLVGVAYLVTGTEYSRRGQNVKF